jgi:hypothetical protein
MTAKTVRIRYQTPTMPTARSAAEAFNRFAETSAAPSRCDPTLAFETPELAHALVLWQEKVGAHGMPSRHDLGARALKAFLPNVVIVDAVGDRPARRHRFRLQGTALTELLGDHTGKFFDEAVVSPFRERWSAMMDATLDGGAPLRFFGRLEFDAQDYLSMELLLAPLSDEGAKAVLLVGYARSSAPEVFRSLVKNTVSA